ncbi:hypothetical protein [Catenulispora pinisilvae]|nr:hypothetical protein [Catenulispora pinisilvae]
MAADFASPRATITAARLPGFPCAGTAWAAVIDFADAVVLHKAALASAATCRTKLGGGADRRAVIRALEATGLIPDRSAFRRSVTGAGWWVTSDRRARAAWAAPHRNDPGGWRITAPTLRFDATFTTPATVLTSIIGAAAPWNRQEPTR